MKFQATNKTSLPVSASPRLRVPASFLSSPVRRGSALLLVVVLVLLLALMGTTFLFVMRAARLQAGGPGSGALMQGSWPTVPQSDLDAAITVLQGRVLTSINNGVRPGAAYLLPVNPESSYTHPATPNTVYLADRFPVTDFDRTGAGTNYGAIMWRYLTANPDHAADPRTDLYASQFRVTYPTSGNWPLVDAAGNAYPSWAMLALSGRTRLFPAMTPTLADAAATASNPASRVLLDNAGLPTIGIAGDADGDGIADCRLYYQSTNGTYDFYTGVRVVDNNAAVNVNTAWRSMADRDFTNPTADIVATDSLTGYLGTFRSNIGLYEMLFGSATEGTGIASAGRAAQELLSLDTFRFGGNTALAGLKTIYSGDDAAVSGTPLTGVEYLTVADALEHGLTRRLDQSTEPGFSAAAARFKRFDEIAQDQLTSRFCLVSPNFSNSQLTTSLRFSTSLHAPNVRLATGVVPQFQFYGANQSDYWYHTALSTDSKAATSRQLFFAASGNANYPNTLTLGNITKTIRPHLVGENGVTVSAPLVAAPAAGLVALSADSTTWNNANAPMADYAGTDTPRKAWANGASFGELWRAYYGVFKGTASDPNPVQASRYGTAAGDALPAWDANRQLLLRSAIAAINTLQGRQAPTADAEVRTVNIGGTDIRLFGAKRQPFITEVMVEVGLVDAAVLDGAWETKCVAIELFNPYSTALDVSKQRIFASTATAWTKVAALSGSIPANSSMVFVASKGAYAPTGTNPLATVPALNLVNLNVTDPTHLPQMLANVPGSGGGTTLRLVTSDGATAETDYGYDMIPQDEAALGATVVVPVAAPANTYAAERFRYARYSGGNGFLCVYNNRTPFAQATCDAATGNWTPSDLTGTLGLAKAPAVGTTNGVFTIQVGNYSTYKPGTVPGQAFPFAGFARDGDLLHVAYIGNYAYVNGVSSYTCSVGRDAFYAEDGNTLNDVYEPVGRFAPLPAVSFGTDTGAQYDWAGRLFDFVTAIQHPGSETNPDSPPELSIPGKEPLAYTGRSIQGKLNINTASWQALAALPLVPVNPEVPSSSSPALAAAETVKLAKAIVSYRDGLGGAAARGPFKSIFELNLVPEFAWRTAGLAAAADLTTFDLNIAGTSGTHGVGDLSFVDNAIGDFEQRLLGLTRISNLITTRSDSFTVYIVAQAWWHGAAPNNIAAGFPPIMVGEKRSAFVMDRTGLTRAAATLIDLRELKDRP